MKVFSELKAYYKLNTKAANISLNVRMLKKKKTRLKDIRVWAVSFSFVKPGIIFTILNRYLREL